MAMSAVLLKAAMLAVLVEQPATKCLHSFLQAATTAALATAATCTTAQPSAVVSMPAQQQMHQHQWRVIQLLLLLLQQLYLQCEVEMLLVSFQMLIYARELAS
jgi:hypothetical protein